jgi:hypothetical protein
MFFVGVLTHSLVIAPGQPNFGEHDVIVSINPILIVRIMNMLMFLRSVFIYFFVL